MSSKTDKKKAIMPKLRFPEFRDSGPWEVKKVGDIFKVTRGEVLSMKLVSDRPSTETPYPVYSSQTKNNGLSGYYSDYLYEDAITWTTDGANAGDVKYRKGKFYCTNVCGVLLNEEGYANNFVAELLNTVTKKHVSYVGNPKLMNGVMAQIQIPLPQIEEQQKIADCLSSIDELIELEAKKLDALKAHKKGLMQQLFPQEGETTPRLRFPEFRDAGPWERYKFGELLTLEYGGSLPEESRLDGSIPVVGSNGVVGFHSEALVSGPIIIVGRKGSVGEVNWIESDCYPIDTTFYVKLKFQNSLLIFIKLLLENANLTRLSDNGAVPGLNRNDVYVLKTALPSEAEQQKIADCLSSIDELIELQTKKLEALKAHKKGLMQQLFPQEVG